MTATYTAANIKILSPDDLCLDPAFDWRLVDDLASKYTKDRHFIARNVAACREAGISPQYFIDRYLKDDKTIPLDDAVDAISKRLQREPQA